MNVQVVTDPSGHPIWTSEGSPGSTHDLSAARDFVIWRLDPYTSKHLDAPLAVLTDKGYVGAGVGYLTPRKGVKDERPGDELDAKIRDEWIIKSRAPGERGNALLKERWHALDKIHADPALIGTIVAATLALTHHDHHGKPQAA